MWNERSLGFPWCFESHDISDMVLKICSFYRETHVKPSSLALELELALLLPEYSDALSPFPSMPDFGHHRPRGL